MVTFLLTLSIIIIGLIIGSTILFAFYSRHLARGEKAVAEIEKMKASPFRWRYIMLPLTVLLLAILIVAVFYRQLPAEVAYYFRLDGSPDRWMSRGTTIVWVLTLQFLLTLVAGTITWAIAKLGILSPAGEAQTKPEKVLAFVGNAIALPQVILCFVTLDIFSYNSYQVHLMPMWIFLVGILGLATVALGLILVFFIVKARQLLVFQFSQEVKRD